MTKENLTIISLLMVLMMMMKTDAKPKAFLIETADNEKLEIQLDNQNSASHTGPEPGHRNGFDYAHSDSYDMKPGYNYKNSD